MGSFLTFALDESGALVHVDDVVKGNKCNCHCPHCNAPLCAKNAGLKREHHFAHAHNHECEGAYESQLHLLAKAILQETGVIMLPHTKNDSLPSGAVQIHNIQVEKWDERYHIKPDVEGVMNNGERLLIEFYVSHKVDKNKRQIIVDNHLKCIEIDINYQSLDKNELKKFLSTSTEDRKWVLSMLPPPKQAGVGGSSYYERNPMYGRIRDYLKEIYERRTLTIHPHSTPFNHHDIPYDLRQVGYDVCEVNTRYRGFKSDLLLYRSQKEDKGHISINIRGRRRWGRYPKGLRIIDIVLKSVGTEDGAKLKLKDGDLVSGWEMTIDYFGFKS